MQRVPGISTAPKELDELQEIARVATRAALEGYEPMPEEWEKNLTLGTSFDGDDRIFELYIAAEKPSDAVVISTAYSTANWTPIPPQTGHPFHGKLDSQSSANWTPIPLQTGQFEAV